MGESEEEWFLNATLMGMEHLSFIDHVISSGLFDCANLLPLRRAVHSIPLLL